jgi:PAS domain S-box-containing protein/putative nucleotidyltransferase with HDIG domain
MSKKAAPVSKSAGKTVSKRAGKGPPRSKKQGASLQDSGGINRGTRDNLDDVFFTQDLQGRFTSIHPAVEQLTGYKADQIVGSTFERFIHPKDFPGLKSSFKRSLAGQPESYEFRILDRDGKIIHVHTSSCAIREAGKAVGLSGVIVEITKLKQTEQALLEAEAKFHSLIEHIPAAVYTAAIDKTSSTLFISPQIEKISGYTPEEWTADPAMWGKIIHPEDRKVVWAEHQESKRTGKRFLSEYRMIARDEHVVWVRDEATIQHDPKGKALCWQGVRLDISEQKQAEAALRQRAEELAAFRANTLDLAGQQDLLSLLRTIVERSMTLIKAPSGFIYLYDETTNDLELTVEKGFPDAPGLRLKMGEGMAGRVAQTRQTLIVDDYSTWKGRSSVFKNTPYHAVVEVPMLFGGQLIGVLGVNDSGEMVCTFTEEDARLLLLFAGQAASAVHDGRLVQGLQLELTERKQAETALEESEERYRQLFDLSPDAIAVHSGGKILLVNTAAMDLLGAKSAEEINGKPMLDFVHPDYRKLVIERTRQQINEGKIVPVMDEKFIRLDGTTIDVEVTAAPIHYRDKLVSLVIFRDISGRKLAEAALKESEAKYRNVVERANDGISIIQDGIVKYANPRLAQMAGLALEEIIGSPFSGYVHPDELPNVADRYKRRMAGEDLPSAYETILVHKNKSKIYVELNAGAIQYEGGIADLVMVRDISERKLAEAALKESETSYQALFDRVSEAIYIQDREGRFLDVNEGAVKMYGYPREYLVGKTPADISAPGRNDLKKIKKLVGKAFNDQPQQFEFWGVRKNGEIFPKDVRLNKGSYFGQDVVIALAQDITQRKRAEDALQRQLKELTVLHTVSMAAAQSSSVDQLVEQVTRIIGTAVYVDDFGVALLDQDLQVLQPHPAYHGESFAAMANIPLTEGIVGHVASTGESYNTGDVRKDPHYLNTVPETRSELCVPIKVGNKLVGVINAESRELHFFNEEDERLLNTIAGTLATAIEKLHLFEAERIRRQEAETLRDAAAAVASSLELGQVLDSILISLKRVVPYDSAVVILLENDQLCVVAVQGFEHPDKMINQTYPVKDSLFSEIQMTGKPIILADTMVEPRFHQWVGTDHVRSWLGVPLVVREEVIGYITLGNHEPSRYHEESAVLVQAFAHPVAAAIENARLYEAEQRRLRESETLRKAALVVASTLDQTHAIQLILDQLALVVPYDSASVLIMKDGYLEIVGGQGWEDPAAVLGLHFPIPGDNPNSLVVEQRSPVILGNAPQQYAEFRQKPHNHILSWLGVPMIVRDRIIGILAIDSKQPEHFTQESLRLVTAFASQAATAIENARLYEEAIQATERRAILHRASQEIARASQDPEQVYAAVHRASVQLMPAEAFAITLVEEQSQETVGVYLIDKGGRAAVDRVPAGSGLSGLVISTGKPVITHDLMADPIPGSVHFGEEDEVRSILAVPLRLADKVVGMLSVQSYQPHAYTDDDQALLEMLAAHAAVAIENARLYAVTLQRLKELEAVNHISTALRSAQTVDEMLPSLLDETLKILGSDSGVIWLYDQVEGVLKERAARGWFAVIQETPIKPGEGIAGTVFKTGQVSVSKEFSSDPLTRESIRAQLPTGWGGACVPIRTGREAIGVVFVSVELPRQLQEDAVHLLVTLCEMAGNAIRRATLHEQTERQLQRLASLRAVDMAINTILDLRVMLGILIDHIISQLKVDAVNILLINPHSPTLYHAASSGFRSEAFKNIRLYISDSLAGQAIRTRTTTHIPDLGNTKLPGRGELRTEEGFVTYFGVPLIAKGQIKGVLETFHRSQVEPDLEWRSFLETLAGQAAIAIDNSVLFEELQQTNMNLSLAYDATIEGWSKALDLRDQGTEGHTLRVAEMTVQLADIMGVGTNDLVHIRRGALLHDIGKMGVPDNILKKNGPLTEAEWAIMHRHPEYAFEMLSPITYLRQALDIPYGHHERWDGSGYPRHLPGEQIPLAARIFAVVDVWDALISDRPYRKTWTKEEAAEFIRENSGILFDPRVVETFLRMNANDQSSSAPRSGTGSAAVPPETGLPR